MTDKLAPVVDAMADAQLASVAWSGFWDKDDHSIMCQAALDAALPLIEGMIADWLETDDALYIATSHSECMRELAEVVRSGEWRKP